MSQPKVNREIHTDYSVHCGVVDWLIYLNLNHRQLLLPSLFQKCGMLCL